MREMKVELHISYIIFGVLLFVVLLGFQLFSESTAVTSSLANVLFRHNFHEVVPGRLFRSAEMSQEDLRTTIEEHHIRSVIDLRLGSKSGGNLAPSEGELVRSLGGEYFHISLRGSRMTPAPDLLSLLDTFAQAPEPILVHCTSGTHRSGVVAALWLLDKDPKATNEATAQLNYRFGYFRWERALKTWFSGHPTIDNVLWEYLALGPKRPTLREWIEQSYRPL